VVECSVDNPESGDGFSVDDSSFGGQIQRVVTYDQRRQNWVAEFSVDYVDNRVTFRISPPAIRRQRRAIRPPLR
jgi:hypothetical protein